MAAKKKAGRTRPRPGTQSISYPRPTGPDDWYRLHVISTGEAAPGGEHIRYPRADGGPIEDLDDDLIYLHHVEEQLPTFDARMRRLVVSQDPILSNGTYVTSYDTEKLPKEERVRNVEAREEQELWTHFQQSRAFIELYTFVSLVYRVLPEDLKNQVGPLPYRWLTEETKAEGLTQQQDFAERICRRVEEKTILNNDHAAALIADIVNNDAEPDLDQGWQDPDPDLNSRKAYRAPLP